MHDDITDIEYIRELLHERNCHVFRLDYNYIKSTIDDGSYNIIVNIYLPEDTYISICNSCVSASIMRQLKEHNPETRVFSISITRDAGK